MNFTKERQVSISNFLFVTIQCIIKSNNSSPISNSSEVKETSMIDNIFLPNLHPLTCPLVSGFAPSSNIVISPSTSTMSDENSTTNLFSLSMKETWSREPYLLFSVLFLCLRLLLFVLPKIVSHLRAFWISCIPHLNLQIFGETCQMMGRVLQVIDVRRIWNKLRLCKTRTFHEKARSARVWASSITSVSLGESSSARSSTQSLN